jgi:ABC-type lipoprotein export system ATPase subunit
MAAEIQIGRKGKTGMEKSDIVDPQAVGANGTAVLAESVMKHYVAGGQTLPVLHELDLTVDPGEAVAILGVSGTGKSTLLNILGGLDQADGGSVVVAGVDLRTADAHRLARFRAERIAFIFQFYNLISNLTAFENVLAGLQAGRRTNRDDVRGVSEALGSVGLEEKIDALPGALSGGEQQRVAIARALIKKAPVILADEPTGNLDRGTAKEIVKLLIDTTRQRGTALVVVSHDPSIVQSVDKAYRLESGRLVVG